ncbi:hypothetical protein [Photorhabdus heterorhabditis]|uniref:hypothetical protein n=1 Tax=Photorhabdus heterorhabditis TaxID=880156 RepID=UPI0015620E65|nr:hypothetical protein [Photorhabdus heterorhabditis]NRN29336.1 hypothetical protein [Photorhabdus heterorhabditis subsp. aluminescens]
MKDPDYTANEFGFRRSDATAFIRYKWLSSNREYNESGRTALEKRKNSIIGIL